MNLAYKKNAYKLINDWEATGNIAMDMIATAISVERRMQRAPKTIYLNRRYWEMYLFFCKLKFKQKELTEDQLAAIELGKGHFDDVEISKSDILTGAKPMIIEYWPVKANEIN